MSNDLAFVTYETRFASCGGITAVVNYLPHALGRVSGLRVRILTPFHHKIKETQHLTLAPVGSVAVPFERRQVTVAIGRHTDSDGIEWYFLRPQDEQCFENPDERFFSGFPHPYVLPGSAEQSPAANLVRDALFFGACVARALPIIGANRPWTLFMQDWEGATAALALASQPREQFRLFLTLHNSYDSGKVEPSALEAVGIDPLSCPGPSYAQQPTILERALQLVEQPVFTVSEQFAADCTDEVLQAEVIALHLRHTLEPRIVGIDNGPFHKLAVDPVILRRTRNGDYDALFDWKRLRRARFLEAVAQHQPTSEEPVWGDREAFASTASSGIPWFVCAGRDDPRQRGHDVAARAVSEILGRRGDVQFLFFPIPGDEGHAGMYFLRDLAQQWAGRVLVLPFRFQPGYFAGLQGATYGVMPSLYEPFGSANEFYLHGTVGIARATGGLLQQIVPLRAAASYSRAVHERAKRWHEFSALPTGILYREKDVTGSVDSWRGIIEAAYDPTGQTANNRVQQRMAFPVFRAMVAELRIAIEDGVRVYRDTPDLYCNMLLEGISYIQRTFSWERAAQEYARVLA
jgi:glycogen synthase